MRDFATSNLSAEKKPIGEASDDIFILDSAQGIQKLAGNLCAES
jgi:hypothetical protein